MSIHEFAGVPNTDQERRNQASRRAMMFMPPRYVQSSEVTPEGNLRIVVEIPAGSIEWKEFFADLKPPDRKFIGLPMG